MIIILLIVKFLYYISFYNDDFGLDNIILWTGGSKFEGSWVWDNGKKKEMIYKLMYFRDIWVLKLY